MTTDYILSKIRSSIANITGLSPDSITDSASYVEDLQLDSLSILEVVADVEHQLHIRIPEERIGQMRTVEDTVKALQGQLGDPLC